MTPNEALFLLRSLKAPEKLLRHVALVSEAGDLLLHGLSKQQLALDASWVMCGILLHDAGKIIYPEELSQKGSQHEPAGAALLLSHQVPPHIARCCLSHAQWPNMICSIEELLVALADTLWKGIRKQDLELRVIDAIAAQRKKDRWDLFIELDALFEKIASGSDDRLMRS
jgi:predicted hydrolase (HD superfamily)